jgi:hypothetical protein
MREPAGAKRCAVAFCSACVVDLQHVAANFWRGLVRADVVRNMFWSCWRSKTIYEGAMDELVDQVVGNVGIARPVAEQAVGIILDFLATEGPADTVKAMLEHLPGAAEAAAAAHDECGGGLFGAAGGVMGVGSRLMSAGLSMSEIQGVSRVLIAYARDKAGDQDVNAIVDSIPGLSQFL